MRITGLVLGFSVGAYLMWRVATPTLVPPAPCGLAPDCSVASIRSAAEVERPGLQVVVYDPAIEPRIRTSGDEMHIPGWTSLEAATADRPEDDFGPEAERPPGLAIVGLGQPDARGICAVLNGRSLGCVALINPGEKDRTDSL